MKIAILADPIDNQSAGVHMYTKHLIQNLLKLDKSNEYIFIHRRENPFFNNTNHIIIPGKDDPNKKPQLGYESFRKFHLIPKTLNNLRPDIVLEPSHIGPFRLHKSIKRAVLIHDLTPVLTPQFHNHKSTRTHRILLPRILRNADLIITPSENTKNDIQQHYYTRAQIEVIYPGITIDPTSAPPPKINAPYILHLGTIEPRKNLPTLINAFKELKQELKIPHKLVLAGGIGWKTEETIKKAKHPDIILTGYLSSQEKQSWLQHAEIFAYPSFYEGFGIPPIEAMTHGIPTITSTGGSLKEIYQNHALTHEPEDKDTLKAHLTTLIQNPQKRNEMSQKHKEYAKRFTWESTAEKTIQAFEKLITRNQKCSEPYVSF